MCRCLGSQWLLLALQHQLWAAWPLRTCRRHWRCAVESVCIEETLFWGRFCLRDCCQFGRFGFNCQEPLRVGRAVGNLHRSLTGRMRGAGWSGWTVIRASSRVYSLRRSCRDRSQAWANHCTSKTPCTESVDSKVNRGWLCDMSKEAQHWEGVQDNLRPTV